VICVSFGKNGDGIQGITDLTSREGIKDAVLEPELISSVLNAERQKRKIIDFRTCLQTSSRRS
jgi:hypothetical protein